MFRIWFDFTPRNSGQRIGIANVFTFQPNLRYGNRHCISNNGFYPDQHFIQSYGLFYHITIIVSHMRLIQVFAGAFTMWASVFAKQNISMQ